MDTEYDLMHDGKIVYHGTWFKCCEFIHNLHSYSFAHALKFEGYSLRETSQEKLHDNSN